jgi:hypothetical protein
MMVLIMSCWKEVGWNGNHGEQVEQGQVGGEAHSCAKTCTPSCWGVTYTTGSIINSDWMRLQR